MVVRMELAPGHPYSVAVLDASGLLVDAVAASPIVPRPSEAQADDIFLVAEGGSPSRRLGVVWTGVICDTSATLTIGPDVSSIVVQPGPVGQCDAMAVGRAVTLTFSRPVDVDAIHLELASP